MADAWLEKFIQQKAAEKKGGVPTSTPAPQPVAQVQPVRQIQQAQPTAAPISKQPVSTHGKLFSGGPISDALDVLRLPEYAISSFAKGTRSKAEEYQSRANGSGQTAFQKFGLGGMADALVSGAKNVLPGVQNRTQFGREEGDYNLGKNLGVKNDLAQTAINFGAALTIPAPPLGKIASLTSKVVSKAPGAARVGGVVSKGTSAAIDYARSTPKISSAIEKVPGLEYFRNPEAGKIIQGATDVATRRISGLYNQINDMAKGLTPAQRVKIGQIIEGGISNDSKLVTRANEIRRISDGIGKEVVDAGLMSPESFAKFKGKYLSHIADIVKQDATAAFNKPKGMLSYVSDAFKQRKNILGSGGQPDYVREFQFPSFKALAGEIQNVESQKALKAIADKYGSEIGTTPTNLSRELINTLIKNKPKIPKSGLGDIPYEQTGVYKENVGQQLLDTLRKKIPAITPEGTTMGSKLKVTNKGLRTSLGGVGSMPGPKLPKQNILSIDSGISKSFTGPRTTSTGEVLLEDILPSQISKQFKGIKVPQEVAEYVGKKYTKSNPNILSIAADKALNAWKLGKTIYSGPGYHARNLMSNQILSDYSTGAGLPKTISGYTRAVKAYLGKGDTKMSQYLQELKDSGVINRVDIGQGIENLKPSVFGQGKSTLKKVVDSPKKFQTATEETAKLNVYSFFRNKGMGIREAVAKAEEAIFSPYNISSSERGLTRGLVPFYSFTRQAVPLVAKTAIKKGGTLTKYEKAKTAVEGLSPEGAGEKPPTPGSVRLPIKDKNGKYVYADPTYVIPHGNFDSSAGGQLPFGLGVNPLISEAASQAYNKDLYFDQPIAKSNVKERAGAQRIQHGVRTFAPNILPTDFIGGIPSKLVGKIPGLPDWAKGSAGINYKASGGSKLYDAFTNAPDYAGRTRSKIQAILDTFGLKSASVNPDQPKFDASARTKALKSIDSEMRTIRGDRRLSDKDKAELLQDLLKARQEVSQQ